MIADARPSCVSDRKGFRIDEPFLDDAPQRTSPVRITHALVGIIALEFAQHQPARTAFGRTQRGGPLPEGWIDLRKGVDTDDITEADTFDCSGLQVDLALDAAKPSPACG